MEYTKEREHGRSSTLRQAHTLGPPITTHAPQHLKVPPVEGSCSRRKKLTDGSTSCKLQNNNSTLLTSYIDALELKKA